MSGCRHVFVWPPVCRHAALRCGAAREIEL